MELTAESPQTTAGPVNLWYAEIEMRRHLRDKIPEEERYRRFYPLEAKPDVAEWRFEEDYLPEDKRYIDENPPEGVTVEADKITVGLEKALEIAQEGGSIEDWVIRNVLDGMLVNEYENERVGLGAITGRYGELERVERQKIRDATGSKTYEAEKANPAVFDIEEVRPDPRPVYVEIPPNHQLCGLSQMWRRRRSQNRDMKVIITARDSATGTGKTTLAIALAKTFDEYGWDASKATLSPEEYVDMYTELRSGEILLGDEAEQMADPRRAMTEQNVTLTQYWSTMRQWEVSTIVTLPSPSMIDSRLKELMDVRINVHQRGLGVVYQKKVDDHTGEVREKRLHRIRWVPLDDDRDYQQLYQMKKERMENFNETAYFLSDDEEERKEPEEIKREFRNERIREAYDSKGYSQQIFADIFDISRERVSQIVNNDE